MVVLMAKSICIDCIWRNSCQKFERINGIGDNRNNPGHERDIFEVIILRCSVKNYDRSYKTGGDKETGMFFCTECNSMHHEWSSIGRSHKKIIESRVS